MLSFPVLVRTSSKNQPSIHVPDWFELRWSIDHEFLFEEVHALCRLCMIRIDSQTDSAQVNWFEGSFCWNRRMPCQKRFDLPSGPEVQGCSFWNWFAYVKVGC